MTGSVDGTWRPENVHAYEPYSYGVSRSLCGGITVDNDKVMHRDSSVTCSGCAAAMEADEHPIWEVIK